MNELKPSTMTDDERLKDRMALESCAQGSTMPGASRMAAGVRCDSRPARQHAADAMGAHIIIQTHRGRKSILSVNANHGMYHSKPEGSENDVKV